MAFEKFTLTRRSYIPKLSIWKRGQIGLTEGAVHHFKLIDYKFAVLYYDKEGSKIGIKFTKEKEEGTLALSVKNTGATLSAKAFLEYYKIEYPRDESFDIAFDEASGLYVAKI